MGGAERGLAPPPYFAVERWCDSPYINRFLSADTVMPDYSNPQDLNRFSYVLNNPLRYTDPTGHRPAEEQGGKRGCSNPKYCQNGKPKDNNKNKDKDKGSGGGGDGHPLQSPAQQNSNGSEPCTIKGVNTTCNVDLEVNATAQNLQNISSQYKNMQYEIVGAAAVAAYLGPVGKVIGSYLGWEAINMGGLADFYKSASGVAKTTQSGKVEIQRFTSEETYGVPSLAYKGPNGDGDSFTPTFSPFTLIAITTLKVR